MGQHNTSSSSRAMMTKGLLILGGVLLIIVLYLIFGSSLRSQEKTAEERVGQELRVVSVEPLTVETSNYSFTSADYASDVVTFISDFEEGSRDRWQGDLLYDTDKYFIGGRSLGLLSIDRKEASAYLKKSMDLSTMEYLEFFLHVEDTRALESLQIKLGDAELENYYEYSLTNVDEGWNLIQIPQEQFISIIDSESTFGWNDIQRVQLHVLSRPNAIFSVRVDGLQAYMHSGDILSRWEVLNDKNRMMFGLALSEEVPRLVARNFDTPRAVLKDVKSVKDAIIEATVYPESKGRSGLFVRGNYVRATGYYFLVGGTSDNKWQMLKYSNTDGWTTLADGTLGNAILQKGTGYTLRAEVRGQQLKFLFSFDGEEYFELGSVKDAEFHSGGAGIVVLDDQVRSLFDNIFVKKL